MRSLEFAADWSEMQVIKNTQGWCLALVLWNLAPLFVGSALNLGS